MGILKEFAPLLAAAALLTGCAVARSPEQYHDDTKKLLDHRNTNIRDCYDGVLKSDGKAGGKVTVKFAFEKQSGKLSDTKLDAAGTTAPESVSKCVMSSLDGIALQPGDRRRGEATWSWEFSPPSSASQTSQTSQTSKD